MEKTLREALRGLVDAFDDDLQGMGTVLLSDVHWCDRVAAARAALENTQGEDREADRPDLEKALEELVFGRDRSSPPQIWIDGGFIHWQGDIIASVTVRPNLAKWLKNRGAE